MRLSQRSYPHPVVGNRDDVPGAAFQAAIEMTSDKQQVYVDANITCSSATINSLTESGAAAFVLHVECSNTLFRRAYEFRTSAYRVTIPADNLNDAVEVNVFVRALSELHDYRVDKAHAEYGENRFEVNRGDILAVGEGHIFHVESSFDSMSRIGSIMQIAEASEDGDLPMRVDFNGDKIVIFLSKKDFADYKLLKAHEGVAGPLTTTLVLPVLVEAIHVLPESDADEDGRRWVRMLVRRIEKLRLKRDTEPIVLAQELLELPVKRALASSRMLADTAG
jgi:hypothetical protein